MTTPDMLEEMQATDERRSKLRTIVRARLSEVETELTAALGELRQLQKNTKIWSDDASHRDRWSKQLPAVTARVEALVREHSVLEGIIDRQDGRWWRVAQFVTGGAVFSLLTYLAGLMFGN